LKIILTLIILLIAALPVFADPPDNYTEKASIAAITWAREHEIVLASDGTLQPYEFLGMAEAINKEIDRLQQMCPKRLTDITIILSREGSIAFYPLEQRKIRVGAKDLEPWLSDTFRLFYETFGQRDCVGELDGRSSVAYLLRHEIGHLIYRGIGLLHKFDVTTDKAWVRANVSRYAMQNDLELSAEIFAMLMMPGYKKGTLPEEIEQRMLEFAGCTLK
jgi:hypothetical protein